MEYKRIDENTIRCIITEEDMESFGLDLEEFLNHSGRSDEFLRYIVEEARDELGYQNDQGIVSMRLEVLNDGRISLTFGSGDERQMREQFLKYLKELAESHLAKEIERILKEKTGNGAIEDKAAEEEAEVKESYRMYCFDALRDVMSYCRVAGSDVPVQSHLYKMRDKYYLIVDRDQLADYDFNLLTAVAFDYGKVLVNTDYLYDSLQEHGALIIKDKAIDRLKAI